MMKNIYAYDKWLRGAYKYYATLYRLQSVRHNIADKNKECYNTNYSCSIVVRGNVDANSSGVDYYGVLEEVLEVKYPTETIKQCILFCCHWYDPLNP